MFLVFFDVFDLFFWACLVVRFFGLLVFFLRKYKTSDQNKHTTTPHAYQHILHTTQKNTKQTKKQTHPKHQTNKTKHQTNKQQTNQPQLTTHHLMLVGWVYVFYVVVFVMLMWFVVVSGLVCLLSVRVVFVLLYGCYVCACCDILLSTTQLLCVDKTLYAWRRTRRSEGKEGCG